MKKIVIVVALTFCVGLTAPVMGQSKPTTGTPTTGTPAVKSLPVKIGLVDMTRVFNEYNKFKDMQSALQAEALGLKAETDGIAAQAKRIRQELGLLKPGAPEFNKLEATLAQLSSDFAAKQKIGQLSIRRKEADIFKNIYVDATAVVQMYAKHFEFTMVMRFNSAKLDQNDNASVANGLSKLVIYHRHQDDITDPVIDYLNRKYAPTKPVVPRAANAGGPTRN